MSPASPEREPPHSVEAEQGVLSSIMHSPRQAIAECAAAGVQPQWFYVPAFSTIYVELRDMWDSGEAIDLVTFTQRLRDKNLLEAVGGPAEVTALQNYLSNLFNIAPTGANLPHYISIVRDKFALRQTLAAGAELVRRATEDQDNPQAVFDEVESRIASIRSLHGRNGTNDLSIRSPEEILALPRDQKSCYLGDRLFTKGGSLVIAGIGGLGKTRLLLQLFVSLIIGRMWCGIQTHVRGAICLLFQTENSNYRLQDDLGALKKWSGDDWPLVESNLKIHTLETSVDKLLYLSDPNNCRRVGSIVRRVNPAIVGFDPLRDFSIGDINTDEGMMETLRVIDRIGRIDNPERSIALIHHAITGRAGAAKMFGLDRSGFARNNKVLFGWTRAQVNVGPGKEDSNEELILGCGKNNDGKEFPHIAIQLNPDMIYEVDEAFDIEDWRERVTTGRTKKQKFTVEMVREQVKFPSELEIGPLAKLIADKIGCGRARSYELVHEARKEKILRFNRITHTYKHA